MAVTSSYGLSSLSGTVELNLDKSQGRLQTDVSRLSSGLRINTAADDPSGLAIAEGLQSKVNGYDQAASNVQDATNAATVADGALQTTTDLLQRVRTLAVSAASDVLSPSDRTNIQTEISQLLHEVDEISQNTNFNGVPLLDGTHSGSTPQQPATVDVTTNAALASGTVAVQSPNLFNNPNFSSPIIAVGNVTPPFSGNWDYAAFTGQAGIYRDNGATPGSIGGVPTPPPPGGGQAAYLSHNGGIEQLVNVVAGDTYTLSITAAGSSNVPSANEAVVNLLGTSQVVPIIPGFSTYQFTATATTTGPTLGIFVSNWFGNFVNDTIFISSVALTINTPPVSGLLVSSAVAANTNFATTAGGVAGLGGTGTADGSIELQVINTGASIAAQETFINSATGAISVSPTLLAPNSTSTLFDNVAISTGNFSTPDVGVTSYVKVSQNVPPVVGVNPALQVHAGADEGDVLDVGLPDVSTSALRVSNVNVVSSDTGNPSLAAEDAIGQIDQSLSSLADQRAKIGAFMVRLNEAASNDNVASVNLQASESNIRDADVAATTTAFTQEQILSSIGTSVLANIKTQAALVEKLFQ